MEKLTDRLISAINRGSGQFALLAVGAVFVLTIFCWKLIYNCIYGPFPTAVAALSAMK